MFWMRNKEIVFNTHSYLEAWPYSQNTPPHNNSTYVQTGYFTNFSKTVVDTLSPSNLEEDLKK